MRTRPISVLLLALAVGVSGCSSDDEKAGSAKIGSEQSESGNGSSANADDASSEGKTAESGDRGAAHTFIYPTVAEIDEAFGAQYESLDLSQQPAECKGNFPKSVPCQFQRTPRSTADGVDTLAVSCDYRSSGNDDKSAQGWVDSIKASSGAEAEEETSLAVPGVWTEGEGATVDEAADLILDLAFSVEDQATLTVCRLQAIPAWDDNAKRRASIEPEKTRAAMLDLARNALQAK